MTAIFSLFGWTATGWYAFGTNVLAFSAVVGGLWALHNHRLGRRASAALWLHEVFKDFYTDQELIAGRELLEYDFDTRLGPLLLLRVTNREVVLSAEQRRDLRRVDLVLNYFEQLLYLQSESHLQQRDTEVFFEYWFDLMRAADRAGLRRYLARCGYERCSEEVGVEYGSHEHVALYGSLMREYEEQDFIGVREKLEYVGDCTLRGELYSLGDWPGMVVGDGQVTGELFKVKDESAFAALDQTEHFVPAKPTGCKYLRRSVRLVEPEIDAWTYIYNWPLTDEPRVSGGSWSQHRRGRDDDQSELGN
jgi:gamma-glutamylcyclotransferase (GGCT)/AIG2-like uncharacterized protein YtfP